MSSTMKLKDEARRYEQQEDWGRAIELYRRALEGQEAGDAELGLYNRIGDLYLRLGESTSAVEYYVQAADRYAEAGFLNNAIALCNKALRYEPDRVPLYEKLGRLCADQGFLTDARRWFLQYAERLAAAGKMDASLGALKEFAELSQDPDVWAQLGRQYSSQGRTDDALASYGRAAAAYAEAGDPERAREVAQEARSLDPAFEPPTAAQEAGRWSPDAVDPGAISGEAPARPGELVHGAEPARDDAALAAPQPVAPAESLESDLVDFTGAGEPEIPAADAGAGAAPGYGDRAGDIELEPAASDAADVGVSGEDYVPLSVDSLLAEEADYGGGVEPAGVALEGVDGPDEEDEPLPLLDETDGPMPMPEWTDVAASSIGLEAAEVVDSEQVLEGGDFASPVVAGAESGVDDSRLEEGFELLERAVPDAAGGMEPAEPEVDVLDDLPRLDVEERPDEPTGPSVAEALAEDIPQEFLAPRTPEDRARALLAEGREDDALDILEHAAGAAQEREATHEAQRLADLMAELAPRSVRALRLRAEAAHRARDATRSVPAHLALAARLREVGDAEAAREAYERVLSADPSHEGARAALAELTPPAAAGDDYVDLAALVGEETLETTRFVVEEELPTGDEDQDFHEMLSQFRSKVSEHVAVEDTASHYDLGIAFKEMGLIDEAIAEFQTALRFGSQRLKVYEELGQCFMEKGDYAIAEKLLRQGSNEMATDPSELLGVNYHLGRCYEELDRPADAREAYERVLSLDIDFRDVSERLARL